MRLRNVLLLPLSLATALLAGCGGGGSDGSGGAGTTPAATYTVGGSVTGLAAGKSVVLQDNGADDLTTTNGSFTFATRISSGGAYAVTVKTNPDGWKCTVSNGSGTLAGASTTAVTIACSQLAAAVWDSSSVSWDNAAWQ